MRKFVLILTGLAVISLSGVCLVAKEKNPDEGEGGDEKTSETTPKLVQENTLEWCRDGEDNDGDGHLDCDDQDCGIYAVCVEKESEESPGKVVVVYETMNQLKRALRSGEITGKEFHRQWGIIRANRATELAVLRVEYKQGKLTRCEYRRQAHFIKKKYEGD